MGWVSKDDVIKSITGAADTLIDYCKKKEISPNEIQSLIHNRSQMR
jgi:hypothetical protein